MAKLVHNTLSAFDAFDDRPALFDGDVEFTYRELLAEIPDARTGRDALRRTVSEQVTPPPGKPGKKALPWPL